MTILRNCLDTTLWFLSTLVVIHPFLFSTIKWNRIKNIAGKPISRFHDSNFHLTPLVNYRVNALIGLRYRVLYHWFHVIWLLVWIKLCSRINRFTVSCNFTYIYIHVCVCACIQYNVHSEINDLFIFDSSMISFVND